MCAGVGQLTDARAYNHHRDEFCGRVHSRPTRERNVESAACQPSERLGAVKAAVALEGYALHCADKVADHRTATIPPGTQALLLALYRSSQKYKLLQRS